MKPTYLYLMVGAGRHDGMFKIGISIDPYARQRRIGQEFDLKRSIRLGYRPKKIARQIEALLHAHFAEYRADLEKVVDMDGYTEWFKMDCFDDAIKIIEQFENHPDFASVTGISEIQQATRGKFIELPDDVYFALKEFSLSESRRLGRRVTETEIIVSALRNYLGLNNEQ